MLKITKIVVLVIISLIYYWVAMYLISPFDYTELGMVMTIIVFLVYIFIFAPLYSYIYDKYIAKMY